MGKHSTPRGLGRPQQIDRLAPSSGVIESPREAARRQREVRRSPAEMARQRQRRKRIVVSVLSSVLLLVLAGAVAAYAYVQYLDRRIVDKDIKVNGDLAERIHKDAPRAPGQPFYMLLLGEDKRPGESRARSDTLILAHVDPQKKRMTLMSIPRDTRVTIPGHGKQKINAAMALGGASLVIDTVKEFTGVPISHYLEVDFNGFRDIVNAIGGVWVDVPRNINDIRAANHVREARKVQKGYQKLDGDHALTFVRSRNMQGDDFTRMEDQQIFLKALAKQTLDIKNVANFPAIIQAVMANVTTDLSVGQIMDLAADFKGMDSETAMETVTAPGESKYINGGWYVISDTDKLEEIVRKMEAGVPLESTETPTADGTPQVKPASVTVAVRNGAGVKGLAAEAAGMLTDSGFPVSEVGNTARPVYDKTIIVFKSGKDADAKAVENALNFGQAVRDRSVYQFKTDVLVIVGKDWRQQFPQPASARAVQ